jgi:hypothetical protein
MKKAIIRITLMLAVLIFFTQCEKDIYDDSAANQEIMDVKSGQVGNGCVIEQTLWAGAGQNNTSKGSNVGKVTATIVGTNLQVVYQMTAPWVLSEAHLWVGKDLKKVPKNAAPGLFPFKENLDFASKITFSINLPQLGINAGDPVYIAAHGVVIGIDGVEGFDFLLPEALTYTAKYFKKFSDFPDVVPTSYFQITVHDGFLVGTHNGWCIDTSTPLSLDKLLNGVAYSSYGALPENLFDKPENLPAINWVVNNLAVGQQSEGGFGAFTMGDFQRAYWLLLENNPNLNVPGGVGSYSNSRVNEIIERALASGLNFIPVCGEKVVLVLVSPKQQTTFIEFPVPCGGGSETAWAFGEKTFIKEKIANKWGWVFGIQCN